MVIALLFESEMRLTDEAVEAILDKVSDKSFAVFHDIIIPHANYDGLIM